MSLFQTVANTGLVVPLTDLRQQIGLTSTDTSFDSFLTIKAASARSYIERETDRILMTETWIEELPYFPLPHLHWNHEYHDHYNHHWNRYQQSQTVELRLNPVQSVSIQYYDATNVLQTLDPSTYYLMTPTRLPATITPATVWPVCYMRPDAVQITMTVGYTTLPPNAAEAVRALVGTWFLYRESEGKPTRELNAGLQRIIEQLRATI